MNERFGSKITFLTVYILEAHAVDTWPLGFDQCYKQTNTLEERSSVARDFIRDNNYEFPIRIDAPPNDAFNTLFAAWPLRFYVIDKNSTMTYICEPFGDIIAVNALESYLEWYFN
jgi:hypothetical protein